MLAMRKRIGQPVMKTTKWGTALLLGLIALMGPRAAQADDIVQINISNLTTTGNPVCGPSGTGDGTGTSHCIDTLNASWLYDSTTNTIVPGTLSSMSTGDVPLPFFETVTEPIASGIQTNFFFGHNSGLLDVLFEYNTELLPGNVINFQAAFLSCSFTCNDEFSPTPDLINPAAVTLSAVPEPASLALLGTGLLVAAGLLRRRAKRSATTTASPRAARTRNSAIREI